MAEARVARRSARVRAPPEAVAALLREDPPPEVQERLGISGYRRLGPREAAWLQAGAEVRARLARDEPGLLVFELERAGAAQRQTFALRRALLGGTRATLTLELPKPAPLPKLRGYLARTLRFLKERAEGRA